MTDCSNWRCKLSFCCLCEYMTACMTFCMLQLPACDLSFVVVKLDVIRQSNNERIHATICRLKASLKISRLFAISRLSYQPNAYFVVEVAIVLCEGTTYEKLRSCQSPVYDRAIRQYENVSALYGTNP